MSRIESRPSKREMGEYIFFVDLELPAGAGDVLQETLAVLKPLCQHLAFFGSYPSIRSTGRRVRRRQRSAPDPTIGWGQQVWVNRFG
jgi:hypothetical protein